VILASVWRLEVLGLGFVVQVRFRPGWLTGFVVGFWRKALDWVAVIAFADYFIFYLLMVA